MCNLNKGTPQQKSTVANQALPPWDGSCRPVDLFYYGGERLQLELAIAAPDAFKEQKENICMTAQPFAADDSKRQPWV